MSIRYPEGHEYMPTDRDLGDHFVSEFNEIGNLHDQVSSLEAELTAARAEIARLKADKERLDWLEQQVHEHLYCSDIAIQSDEDDGVWFSKIYRHDCGELKGESYDPTDCKTQTVREAIDAARAKEGE